MTDDNPKPPTTPEGNGPHAERVRSRAYALWERDGRPEGAHETHWHEARRQIDEEEANSSAARPEPDPETADVQRMEADATPQMARSRHGSRNSGVTSAEPRIFSGKDSGDATFPLKQDNGKT